MVYKLYTDRENKFECSIQVEGTSLYKSQVRIILETDGETSYLFKGDLYDNGVCDFNLPKLKNILKEGDKGVLTLEVIADDVRFEPWSSEFKVVSDKKVNVVVKEQKQPEKPKVSVNEITLKEFTEKDQIKEQIKEQVKEQIVVESEIPKEIIKKKIIITKKEIQDILRNKKG